MAKGHQRRFVQSLLVPFVEHLFAVFEEGMPIGPFVSLDEKISPTEKSREETHVSTTTTTDKKTMAQTIEEIVKKENRFFLNYGNSLSLSSQSFHIPVIDGFDAADYVKK